MPDHMGADDMPPTIAALVRDARGVFVRQSAPFVDANEEHLIAAFNNAIVEIVSLLEGSLVALADTADDNLRGRADLHACDAALDAATHALMLIVHKAGGAIVVTSADVRALPRGTELDYEKHGRDYRVVTRNEPTN